MTHEHSHLHSDGQGGHSHSGETKNRRALATALAITAAYTAVEVIGGLITGSLALLADAGHMLSDNFSLGLALIAFWLSAKPPTPERSFGYKRAEILAALVNGMTLVAISLWIFYEAYQRFQDPPEILGGWMMTVAVIGLSVNVAAAWVLMRSKAESLNLQGALRHILADLAGSAGVIAAALDAAAAEIGDLAQRVAAGWPDAHGREWSERRWNGSPQSSASVLRSSQGSPTACATRILRSFSARVT